MFVDVYKRQLSPDLIMEDALNIFQENRFSGAPVVNENGLVGLLSIEDIIRALRRGQVDARVHECMTTKLITVNKYDPVIEALKTFSRTNFGRLLVLDENNLLAGILTKGDLSLIHI